MENIGFAMLMQVLQDADVRISRDAEQAITTAKMAGGSGLLDDSQQKQLDEAVQRLCSHVAAGLGYNIPATAPTKKGN